MLYVRLNTNMTKLSLSNIAQLEDRLQQIALRHLGFVKKKKKHTIHPQTVPTSKIATISMLLQPKALKSGTNVDNMYINLEN